MGNCFGKPPPEPAPLRQPRPRESRDERKRRHKANKKALTVYGADGSDAFISFPVGTWTTITSYLRCDDVMNLRLASLGIPRAVTLNPALTSHLNLNLDKCPWYDWVWKRRMDDAHLARVWCRREGVVDFPRDVSAYYYLLVVDNIYCPYFLRTLT